MDGLLKGTQIVHPLGCENLQLNRFWMFWATNPRSSGRFMPWPKLPHVLMA